MKIRFAATGFAIVLAACSNGGAGHREFASPTAEEAQAPGPAAVGERARPFASAPDRGDLLAYRPEPPRRIGPSTWHRADISEEHALRAAVTGKLRITTPGREVVDYRFRHHVEHRNGNWSWIGELPGSPGSKAIVTFGEEAAFGIFHRPGLPPLNLTVRDGVAWIVESDPRALRGVDPGGRPDYRIVPKGSGPRSAAATASAMESSAATASSTPMLDLVVGYTSGFAASLGSQSKAVTRVTHLVTVTNEAYESSRVNARVRLVRTVQVNYPDNTANDTALYDLTGSDGDSSVTIPASLQPLRQARDQYGGDLVALVRKFQEPEHGGCGVAWLIGGGGSSFTTADAAWGYSLVSDGRDDGYGCREETLAHELGHNLGQNHNTEDSGGDQGVHAYSYGYRESSATGFYTIMAYRQGDSQYSIPYFANPNVAVDGRPTGVANASDNVRSMAQTIPVAAAFRSTVVPLAARTHDFNGDGVSDVLWRNTADGRNIVWRSASSASAYALSTVGGSAWIVAGFGDFNGDAQTDIFWRNTVDGRNSIWLSGNSATPRAVATVGSQAWVVAGVGDFNGDGVSDVLWRNTSDGRNSIWRSANSATPQNVSTVGSQSWTVAGVGDFNGDAVADILWRNVADGRNSIWRSANSAAPQSVSTVGSQSWTVAGIGDFNSDGVSDVLWRNVADGRNSIWRSANSAAPQTVSTVGSQSWRVAGVGDFNGDGASDILWRNTGDGRNSIWRSGDSATPQAVTAVAPAWAIQW